MIAILNLDFITHFVRILQKLHFMNNKYCYLRIAQNCLASIAAQSVNNSMLNLQKTNIQTVTINYVKYNISKN